MRDWVRTSGKLSIALQFLFGIVSLFGFMNINEKPEILQTLLICDVVVQFIEFLFYIIFIRLENMKTYYRYIDWYITTPTMLISTVAFMEYLNDNTISTKSFAETYTNEIIYIILMNSMMLSFGLVGELGYTPYKLSVLLGFLPFIATFVVMFLKFARSQNTFILLTLMCIIWTFYGFFALLDYYGKNIGYNILDLFSKNLFGLLLSIYMLNI